MKRLFGLLLAALLLSVTIPSAAFAVEQITFFELNAEVDEAAQATITETIHYDFDNNERRGIFRDIPTSYIVEGDQGFNLELDVQSVLRNGQPEQFRLEQNQVNQTTIRIGDPDVFITGTHQYTIVYDLGPIAIAADDGNEIIRLDAPGTDWDVPVNEVRASINGPVNATQQFCYIGFIGSTDQNCNGSGTGFVAFSGTNVGQGRTITIEAVYNAGTFSQLAGLETISFEEPTPWPLIGLVSAAGVTGLGFGAKRLISAVRYRQRRREETIYPRYEPPTDMTPGEIGLLIDNSISGAELSATLLHLATSGFIKITQTKSKGLFRKADYSFTKLKNSANISQYDDQLFQQMFANGKTETTLDELRNNTGFTKKVFELRKQHEKQLEIAGFYGPFSIRASDLDARVTDAGYTKWAEVSGFQMFLEFTEKDRLKFLDAPDKNPEQFSAFLPYAVALGVERQWANQFNDLMVDTSSWFAGPGGRVYTAGALSQLGRDLNTFSTTVASSSGTSGAGGGFSGGGFGGGGGGSW